MAPDQSSSKHIVVLGAGFGGLTFCQKFNSSGARITLIDRQNHHLFQPLLYQVATAGLSAPEIAQPIRSILAGMENVTVLMDEVTGFDLAARKVTLLDHELQYDYLVLALGGVTSYFGHPEWEQFAPGLKNLADAFRIRREVLLAFEHAELEDDPQKRTRLMTMVVIGGGPTGVEMAGAFKELARNVLAGDFRRIDPAQARVLLIEAGDRILATFPPDLSASAQRQLETIGVEVRVKTRVTGITADAVELGSEKIEAANKVWAAGVAAVPLTKLLGVELDRSGRVNVQPDLSLPGHPEVFAVGDIAALIDKNGVAVPGVSPAAMQMAVHAAKIIASEIEKGANPARPPFAYWDKGIMATIGRSHAVAKTGPFKFSGFPAWMAWLLVHLLFLVGLKNKITVFLQWVYAYFTYKQGARVIVTEDDKK